VRRSLATCNIDTFLSLLFSPAHVAHVRALIRRVGELLAVTFIPSASAKPIVSFRAFEFAAGVATENLGTLTGAILEVQLATIETLLASASGSFA